MKSIDFFEEIEFCISEPKLSAYDFFSESAKPHVRLGAHMILLGLSSHFYLPLQLMEVTLRNRVDKAMIEIYSSKRMRNRIHKYAPKGSTPENWYEWMPNKKESRRGVALAKSRAREHAALKGRDASRDDVISEITLGVWIHLLKEKENNKDPFYFWENAVRLIFPYRGHVKRNGIFYGLDEVLYIRNRLFHHEPIWKGPNVATFEDAVKKLHSRINIVCNVVAWMSQAVWEVTKHFTLFESFNEACLRGLEEFESKDYS